MAWCVTFAVVRIRVKGLPLEIGEILHIFPTGTESMGDRGSKKAYTGPRTGIYLPTKFGCDRSIVVGCRTQNDRQTSRQTDKQNGMTIRLTLCERDTISSKVPRTIHYINHGTTTALSVDSIHKICTDDKCHIVTWIHPLTYVIVCKYKDVFTFVDFLDDGLVFGSRWSNNMSI